MPNVPKKQKKSLRIERHMVRPLIYQVFTRFIISLTLALLWARFIAPRVVGAGVAWGFQFLCAFFAVMAWFAWLRLDGMKVPTFDRKLFRRKKKPPMAFGDMIDFVDEPVVTFEELTDDEKDVTLLYADVITAVIFLVLGLVF